MNKKLIFLALATWAGLSVVFSPVVGAVKVAPLTYNIQLTNGQKKKGFVDVTNTEPVKTTFTFTVQAFKQINAQGDLQFYDDARTQAGIVLDYTTFEIEPDQTLRLAFVADSTKLLPGDSFGAIFATAAPKGGPSTTAVRVGTILTIQNGTPAEHKAEVTNIAVPFFQIGDAIKGSYGVRNTSDPQKSAGFMPKVDVSIDPFHAVTSNQSSLVFAGIERQNNFSIQTNRFGFYKVAAAFGDSKKEAWVFVATPLALFVSVTAVGLATFVAIALIKRFRSPQRGARHRTKRHIPTRD